MKFAMHENQRRKRRNVQESVSWNHFSFNNTQVWSLIQFFENNIAIFLIFILANRSAISVN